jgi:hypothetical protein
MVEWLKLSDEQRRNSLTVAGGVTGLPVVSIEKDWWVTLTLQTVFSTPYASNLLFKGGTSLSKGWQLIERFSEDIDLAVDREMFGFAGDLTNTQIKKLKRRSCEFTSNELRVAILEILNAKGVTAAEVQDPDKDPQQLILRYASLYDELQYFKPQVLVEVSSRSLKEPWSNRPIQSFIGESIPDQVFSDKPFNIPTVAPKRTFLEKAFLLHEEFLKAPEKIKGDRMSRHLYDLEKLMDSNHGIEALDDATLYRAIVQHRSVYNKQPHVDYATLAPHTISFIPPQNIIESWSKDYKTMEGTMIYGEALSFEKLMGRMHELLTRFRKLNHTNELIP